MWGCDEPERPWSARPNAQVVTPPSQFIPTPPPAQIGSAGDGVASTKPTTPRRPSRVGGLWVSCYGGFRDSGTPLTDVTRLGMLCGPVNGMRPHGEPHQGQLAPGKIVTIPLKAKAGSCFRVFAVAASPITDLNVVVRSPRGHAMARDDSHDRWPIVEPERPFCALEDGIFSLQLSAAERGEYAVAVWRLPIPTSRRSQR